MSARPTLDELADLVRQFEVERSWERYHDAKNLAMALASEVGELCAILRWVPNAEVDAFIRAPRNEERLRSELGDVGILFLALCSRLEVNPAVVITEKLRVNAENYPVRDGEIAAERPSSS